VIHNDCEYIFRGDGTPAELLQMLLNLPSNMHIMVRHTAIVLIGDLSQWMSNHEQFIGKLFYFLYFWQVVWLL